LEQVAALYAGELGPQVLALHRNDLGVAARPSQRNGVGHRVHGRHLGDDLDGVRTRPAWRGAADRHGTGLRLGHADRRAACRLQVQGDGGLVIQGDLVAHLQLVEVAHVGAGDEVQAASVGT
ncbi:hypothetical protein B8W90_11485, partial [Staphylococcus hominis]